MGIILTSIGKQNQRMILSWICVSLIFIINGAEPQPQVDFNVDLTLRCSMDVDGTREVTCQIENQPSFEKRYAGLGHLGYGLGLGLGLGYGYARHLARLGYGGFNGGFNGNNGGFSGGFNDGFGSGIFQIRKKGNKGKKGRH